MTHGTYCTCIWCFVKEVVPLVIIVMTGICIFILITNSIIRRTVFLLEVQKIEQVRKDLAVVSPGDRGELIEHAVDWNQFIVENRYWNSKWYADFMYPDGWNDILFIDILGD